MTAASAAHSGAVDEILQALRVLYLPGQVVELRVPKGGPDGTISGFFNKGALLAQAAAELSGRFPGIYTTLNPLRSDLIERSPNRLTRNADKGTLATDADVTARRWMLVDVDPERPADMSSTDAERAAAFELASRVADWLADRGWPLPILADSGNGAHLLYRVDLPNDEPSKALIHGVLRRLAAEFNANALKIDTKVANASRICKVYGTVAAKGTPTDERPHRAAALLDIPKQLDVVTPEQLAAVQPVEPAAAAPAATATPAPMSNDDRARRYAMAALDGAVTTVANAGPGTRNDTLNSEAYGVFRWVAGGQLNHSTVWSLLEDAALRCGLERGEINSTLHSAWDAAQKSPRTAADLAPLQAPPPRRAPPAPAPAAAPMIDPETGEFLEPPPPANDNALAIGGHDLAAVDWYGPFPDATGKGKPLSTIENVREACRRLGVTVRYNVISKEIEILIPGEGFSIDNQANAALAWLTSACMRFGVPTGQLGDFLTYLADRNQYNPVAQWITSRPWDGKPRLQALFNTIKADGEDDDLSIGDLKEAMLRRWLISAVAGAFGPRGVSAHGVLVLQGEQYLGKTKWFKSLVPPELGVIQDGLMLRPDDRDSVKQAVSYWLVELGELDATFRKSDIAQLKAFITRDRDTLRRAYAKLESHYARRTVFFASVNPRQFLHDPTGNRRYWTISCASIDHDHGLDMQQVWAEVYETLYRAGEGWFLTQDELAALNAHNKDHEVLDPIRERLLTRFDWNEPDILWRWMTATDIMLDIGFDKPNRADVTQCGQIIGELNGNRTKKSNGKRLSRVPPRVHT